MFIKRITVENFKCFYGKHNIDFCLPDTTSLGSGLSIFVGENNSGKSTIFEAIDFLRDGTKKDLRLIKNKKCGDADIVAVEILFSGKVNDIIENFAQGNKKDVFKKYIFEKDGIEFLGLLRSSSDLKAISLWDEKEQKYTNESGIDAPLKKLFETNFVWADTNPNDEISFGSTTICGNLLKEIVKKFEETDEYKGFLTEFHKIFNDETCGLKKELKLIEEKTQKIFLEQFGKAKISFHFDELKAEAFFKNTRIEIDDGTPTYMEEKGSGMQRAIALALLQVYAEELVKHPDNLAINKPFFLFIDEPELCLHPQAQKKLLNALLEISKARQVFITTHSPYFIKPDLLTNVYRFENRETNKVLPEDKDKPIILEVKKDFLNLDICEIFFAKKVLCVEGKTDLNRFSIFFSRVVEDFVDWTIVKMNGKEEAKKFWKILKCFCTEFKIIFDLDAIRGKQKNKVGVVSYTNTFKNFFATDDIHNKVIALAKENRSELLDSSLTDSEKTMKSDILNLLKNEGIFVLREGEIEDYLDNTGIPVDDAKRAELEAIFT